MKTVLHTAQYDHNPEHYLSSGVIVPNPETPTRIDRLLKGSKMAGLEAMAPTDYGLAAIEAIHTGQYLTFLKNIHSHWQTKKHASPEVIPNVHPVDRALGYPTAPVGQVGYHTFDTACPIAEHTWHSAYWSAQTAIHTAQFVMSGESAAYALCRPPGHHASSDVAGGFCFFNNAAIAAQLCVDSGLRPSIIDVDLHHGNGTQQLFYQREDVLTVSIHADTEHFYPFYWGYSHEIGAKDGEGANLNLPIALGSDDAVFLNALKTGLEKVSDFDTNILIISLGLDAFKGDPFGGLKCSSDCFSNIGKACKELNLPTIIIQEGGYICPELSDNLANFLGEFV